MTVELKVHPSFFREFATKTWVSPNEIIKELVENAFDEDANNVLVTVLKDGSVIIEDDAGMNADGMEKFLLLGSPHKKYDSISPRLRRVRTGRYGTGRLSFLTSFQSMKLRTRRDAFHKSIHLEASVLDRLSSGNTQLNEINEPPLKRNGTELRLTGPKLLVDPLKLSKEIRKLAVLRQPLFRVFIKSSDVFTEWSYNGAEALKAPDIQGHRLGVNLDKGKIIGEIVIAKRPLTDDENGIAIMVGNHVVTRSSFGFDNRLKKVTGYVRCDSLTSRFADKSALIEDEEYSKFYQEMQRFITDTVFPSLTEFEDVLITKEESRIYREIDKVLGQAIVENIETEEVEGYETVEVTQGETKAEARKGRGSKHSQESVSEALHTLDISHPALSDYGGSAPLGILHADSSSGGQPINQPTISNFGTSGGEDLVVTSRKVRRPILKKTFALKKVGYNVIPYEDESDSRYSFTNENFVFVNKANSTYAAEARRGDEFLLRHIIGIVAEAIAESRHPEGRSALGLQNRLVAEAIRIHDDTSIKR